MPGPYPFRKVGAGAISGVPGEQGQLRQCSQGCRDMAGVLWDVHHSKKVGGGRISFTGKD